MTQIRKNLNKKLGASRAGYMFDFLAAFGLAYLFARGFVEIIDGLYRAVRAVWRWFWKKEGAGDNE